MHSPSSDSGCSSRALAITLTLGAACALLYLLLFLFSDRHTGIPAYRHTASPFPSIEQMPSIFMASA
jgi:hypothetical protein